MNSVHYNLIQLFSSLDAFDQPFRDDVRSRLLLFPTDGYGLSKNQFDALAAACARIGETNAQCVITEGLSVDHLPSGLEQYRFSLTAYDGYRILVNSTPVAQENAVISDDGTWGLLISQESHAVLGGPLDFVEAFKESYPMADSDVSEFIRAWEGNARRINSDISWMPSLLEHLR